MDTWNGTAPKRRTKSVRLKSFTNRVVAKSVTSCVLRSVCCWIHPPSQPLAVGEFSEQFVVCCNREENDVNYASEDENDIGKVLLHQTQSAQPTVPRSPVRDQPHDPRPYCIAIPCMAKQSRVRLYRGSRQLPRIHALRAPAPTHVRLLRRFRWPGDTGSSPLKTCRGGTSTSLCSD